ncbi:MAG: hypothetical protein ACO3EP_02405, partial [Phycisphaerales bacterium]
RSRRVRSWISLGKELRRAEPILAALRTARERLPVRVADDDDHAVASAPSVLRSRLRDELSAGIRSLIAAS